MIDKAVEELSNNKYLPAKNAAKDIWPLIGRITFSSSDVGKKNRISKHKYIIKEAFFSLTNEDEY